MGAITPQQKIAARERMAKALELRKAGMTYQQIATALDYGSVSASHKAVCTALKSLIREPAEEVRTFELERLDKMLSSHWPAVTKGHVRSTEVVLRIMERRAALLGLDAPKDTRMTGTVAVRLIGVDPVDI